MNLNHSITNQVHTYLYIGALILLSANPAPSQSEGSGHQVLFLKELVQDMQEAEWTDQTGERLVPGNSLPQRGRVAPGVRRGQLKYSDASPVKEPLNRRDVPETAVIDIQLNPAPDTLMNEVRGAYTISLPNLKRIQLELDYDLLLENPEDTDTADFFVEVYERDAGIPNGWKRTGELHQKAHVKAAEARQIYTLEDESRGTRETFVSHAYNANLTRWAGKEIKLALTAAAPRSSGKTPKGRWLQARLMGATFDYKIASE
jgi:hypothetical protein